MTALRVLHVDDEPDIRKVVKLSLSLDPTFTILSCGSGAEALAAAPDWSPDGKVLAFISVLLVPGIPKGTIEIWDPSKGDGQSSEKNTTRIATEGDLVPTVAWSPDGKKLVSGSFDRLVKMWDVASKQNTATFTGHGDSVESVAWSPDGKQIASGSWDRTARIWEVGSGKEIAKFVHPDYVNSVAWSPDGKYLATGGQNNFSNVRIWKVK